MKTCGELYKDAWTSLAPDQPDSFAAGFICGQAEKVRSGACQAAMFRVSDDRRELVLKILYHAMRIYHVCVAALPGELWICRDGQAQSRVLLLNHVEVNSPRWHLERAALTGIPTNEVDVNYHELPEHGVRCD